MDNLIDSNTKVSFYEHLEPLLRIGQEFYGTNTPKRLICNGAGIEPARWSQFANKTKNFTSYYVYRILKSFNMEPDQYEAEAKMVFSEQQIEELRAQKFIDHHMDLIRSLMQLNGKKNDIEMIKKIISSPERIEVLRKIFND